MAFYVFINHEICVSVLGLALYTLRCVYLYPVDRRLERKDCGAEAGGIRGWLFKRCS